MLTIMHNNHKIQVHLSAMGREVVYHDDNKVSVKWSMGGGRHVFKVKEDGEEVEYEVEISPLIKISLTPLRAAITVRRNGKIIYTDR